jgi:hypothetical protein
MYEVNSNAIKMDQETVTIKSSSLIFIAYIYSSVWTDLHRHTARKQLSEVRRPQYYASFELFSD